MAERKPFLLRLDPGMLEALQRWAADDLRSLNGQIEFLLRRALQSSGRVRASERARPRGPETGRTTLEMMRFLLALGERNVFW